MSVLLRNKSITVITFICLLTAGCGDPVKTPFRSPNLSDATANSLIAFQEDFDTEGGRHEGDFSSAQFQGYRYAAPEGAVVIVSVERLSGTADPVLILYGPQRGSGVWGAAVAVSDDAGESVNSELKAGPLATGTYLFVVTARDYPSAGRFRITLRCVAGCEAEPECPLTEICAEDVCHTGFVTDENGCATCECLDECQSDRQCGPEEACLRGVCEPYCHCSNEYQPVCGVNGVTYRNQCEAGCAGVDVISGGECSEDCDRLTCDLECRHGYVRDDSGCEICECLDPCAACDHLQEPVCTRSNRTYTNRCQAECRGETVSYAGECREECAEITCELDCPNGFVRDEDGCATCSCQERDCSDDDTGQVCGANGVTYANECEAAAADVEIAFRGGPCPPTCAGDSRTPAVTAEAFTCPEGYECVAGVHGLPDCDPTDDGCLALCIEREENCNAFTDANTCPESESCNSDGLCESRCGCTDVFYPVCGSDGATYSNNCVARCNGITSADSGACCDIAALDVCDLDCPAGFAVDPASGCELCECAVTSIESVCTCDATVVNPVCGADGSWYCNECLARCEGVRVADTDTACATDIAVDPRRACGD